MLRAGEYPGTCLETETRDAGAFYGVEGIPAAWRERVARREEITDLASRLLAVTETDANHPKRQTQV